MATANPIVAWHTEHAHLQQLLELGSVIPDRAGRSSQALQKLVESEVARWTPILTAAAAQ